MVVPVTDQAAQQIGTPQKSAVPRGRPADDDVVAAARAGVLSVQHEFLRAQAGLARKRVDRLGSSHQFVPRCRGWMFTSITPGSGVTLSTWIRGSNGSA